MPLFYWSSKFSCRGAEADSHGLALQQTMVIPQLYGKVVVGWFCGVSTTLHRTHHVTHVGSRDTSVSSPCLPFLHFRWP